MKRFLIYTNLNKDKNLTVTKSICDYLTLQGAQCDLCLRGRGNQEISWMQRREDGSFSLSPDQQGEAHFTAQGMIVLGGDGTILQAARDSKGIIPMVGVNLGRLGYMTEIEPAGLHNALDRLLQDDYTVESRIMLHGRVTFESVYFADGRLAESGGQAVAEAESSLTGSGGRGGKGEPGASLKNGDATPCEEDWALNDIVISRRGPMCILRFDILVNGQFLNSYGADGVIVTTPTGSTGYNLSAGGPIVEPKARLMIVTPVCSHALNQRSIILSPENVIEIRILPGSEGQCQEAEVNFDGSNHTVLLKTGDKVRITVADRITRLIRLGQDSFLETLHKKLSDSQGKPNDSF